MTKYISTEIGCCNRHDEMCLVVLLIPSSFRSRMLEIDAAQVRIQIPETITIRYSVPVMSVMWLENLKSKAGALRKLVEALTV